jgi:hypothetical protein
MQQVRFEGSLLASLTELKAIEEQRVAEERAARELVEQTRIQQLADAECRRREAEEAKVRAEHEAHLAREQARLDAEREARLRIEALEATERARHQIELDRARLDAEVELRRAEVAKKRPTWMLAVTVFAMLATGVLVYVAIDSRHAEQQATETSKVALAEKDEAKRGAAEAGKRAEHVERELAELDRQINDAIKRLDLAAEKEAIADQKAHLKRLSDERAKKARDAAEAAEAVRIAKRKEKVIVDDACANNPLCPKPAKK